MFKFLCLFFVLGASFVEALPNIENSIVEILGCDKCISPKGPR